MPLGLPPHLAARTTSTAVARAGHIVAMISLGGAAIVILTVQVALPQLLLWPAAIVVVPMIVLLVLLERTPSSTIAVGYLLVGALSIAWYSLILSSQLGTPIANDEYTVGLLKFALIMVVGVSPRIVPSMLWTTAGFVTGELAAGGTALALGVPWRFDASSLTTWIVVVALLGIIGAGRLADRPTQPALYRAARDEMLADARRVFEARAAALLHDTVLNQLATIASSGDRLPDDVRASVRADLATIVGEEWFAVHPANDGAAVGSPLDRGIRLRAAIADAAGPQLAVSVDGDPAVLDALEQEAFDELVRAIAQAIVNVRRHAGVDEAEVILGAGRGEVSAMVIDGGRGFTARADDRLGVATSIITRLGTVGGTGTVWSQPGKGTSVLLRLPATADAPVAVGRAAGRAAP